MTPEHKWRRDEQVHECSPTAHSSLSGVLDLYQRVDLETLFGAWACSQNIEEPGHHGVIGGTLIIIRSSQQFFSTQKKQV